MASRPTFRAPLFDRLADDEPDVLSETVPLRCHDQAAAAQSIRDELSRLLNTRRATRLHLAQASIIDYGIGDWSGFAATRPEDQRAMERNLAQLIRTFEPRIQQPQVRVTAIPAQPRLLRLQISGRLAGDADQDPILFMNAVLNGDTLEAGSE